ncbi:MAG: ATP-binding cassette domain-containing protein, partial [Spirochaetales bacterium]|nr:ATP-binding cassette domain-containing protein [Spirochaetales bacterium]
SADAIDAGIGMVHQHFMISPELTVLENIILGNEPVRKGLIDWNHAMETVSNLCSKYDFRIPLLERAGSLPMGTQQKVEILKILYKGADIIILDEPTAVLTPQETEEFFNNMKLLTDSGKTIIFITHKLKEVMQVADEVVVMRQAKLVHSTLKSKTGIEVLAYQMVGSGLADILPRKEVVHNPLISLENVSTKLQMGKMELKNISFCVSHGEILGIAGVSGNGQKELSDVLAGLDPITSGDILWKGQSIKDTDRKDRRSLGISYISEDRKGESLCLPWGVDQNCVAGYHDKEPFATGILKRIVPQAVLKKTQEFVEQFSIKVPLVTSPVENLSGGNQQKVVVARETMFGQKLIVAAEPTRGIDIGAISFVHNHLMRLRNNGTGIILISSDLDEIFTLSDRIAVMYEGELVTIVDTQKVRREDIGLHMAGLSGSESK